MATTIEIQCDPTTPQVSAGAGNAFWNVISLTAHDVGLVTFVKDVDGKYYYGVKVPKNLNATPNAKLIAIIMANATTGVVRLSVKSKAVADDAASFNPSSLTAETAQDITVPATARLTKKVTFPTSGNLAETIAVGNLLIVELFHEGAHTNDTLAVNTEVLGVFLQCDVN